MIKPETLTVLRACIKHLTQEVNLLANEMRATERTIREQFVFFYETRERLTKIVQELEELCVINSSTTAGGEK